MGGQESSEVRPWDEKRVREWLDSLPKSGFRYYQQIDLPYGLRIAGRDRSRTARVIFQEPPRGRRVLDIGCDFGYFCHEAIRLGAVEAVGLERNPDSVALARTITEIKGGPVTVLHGNLEEPEVPALHGPFDLVLLLNVIHHFRDPFAAMKRLAALARQQVIVEFPTPADRLFRRVSGLGVWGRRRYDNLPFIGLGPNPAGGFFFTPRSFEVAFVSRMELFSQVRFTRSPGFPDRMIAFCDVRHSPVPAPPAPDG
jgi:SAM-dependent methyltransferase